jgi:hypothetical protein
MLARVKVQIIIAILVAAALSGFVRGGHNVFWNAANATISIEYRSSTIGPVSTRLARGTSLNMSNDDGEVISLRVVYPHRNALVFGANDLNHIKAASHLPYGVWWITDREVRFVSARDAARGGHKLRSH